MYNFINKVGQKQEANLLLQQTTQQGPVSFPSLITTVQDSLRWCHCNSHKCSRSPVPLTLVYHRAAAEYTPGWFGGVMSHSPAQLREVRPVLLGCKMTDKQFCLSPALRCN